MTPERWFCTELTNTFCTVVESPATDSTKYTRSLLRDSPNTPGVTRVKSSRASRRDWYCSPICAAHGEMTSESTAINATSGPANVSTGRTHAVSEMPALNQTTISESR